MGVDDGVTTIVFSNLMLEFDAEMYSRGPKRSADWERPFGG